MLFAAAILKKIITLARKCRCVQDAACLFTCYWASLFNLGFHYNALKDATLNWREVILPEGTLEQVNKKSHERIWNPMKLI